MQLPECQKCGACCVYGEQWVAVTENDLTHVPLELTERGRDDMWQPFGRATPLRVMRAVGLSAKEVRCVALEGWLGVNVCCTIYPNRPSMCAKFERGSQECLWLLGYHGIGQPIEVEG